jgi:hypothetical protein
VAPLRLATAQPRGEKRPGAFPRGDGKRDEFRKDRAFGSRRRIAQPRDGVQAVFDAVDAVRDDRPGEERLPIGLRHARIGKLRGEAHDGLAVFLDGQRRIAEIAPQHADLPRG